MLPVYLQVVLGSMPRDRPPLLPMSVTMLIAALTGPKIAARRSPKGVPPRPGRDLDPRSSCSTLDIELNDVGFLVGLAVFGVGAGLLASQLGNVIISAARGADERGRRPPGHAQNLGASLGTALIGAILLIGLTNGFVDGSRRTRSPASCGRPFADGGERPGPRSHPRRRPSSS